ncbi:MAG TPA: ankyrin repeat domain-containing protein [Chlamydiales bacterium]|nr:ankyrin repeat domain-containing protein [Chlamydiales bacterium]
MTNSVSQYSPIPRSHAIPTRKRSSFCCRLGTAIGKVASAALNAFVESGSKFLLDNFFQPVKRVHQLDPVDAEGYSALYKACRNGHFERARELMAKGANPYQMMPDGRNALFYARFNLPLLKILTRTENAIAFRDCRTVQDFWKRVYPDSLEMPDHDRLIRLLPKDPVWEEWEKRKPGLVLAETMPTIAELTDTPTLIDIEYWKSKHPFFKLVWELAGEPEIEYIDSVDPEFQAYYNRDQHKIMIHQCDSQRECVERLFLEIFHPLQNASVDAAFKLREMGKLTRNEYAYLMEWLEYRSGCGRFLLLSKDMDQPPPWILHWGRMNRAYAHESIAHADFHRRNWDGFAWKFAAVNCRTLEARLAKLRSQ